MARFDERSGRLPAVSVVNAVAQVEFWLAIPILLVLWPLFESARRGRWGWFWVIVLVAPLGGMGWVLAGRWRRVPARATS